jgi:hypothetical protein
MELHMQSPLRESTTGRDVAPPVQDGFRGGTAGHLTWIAGDAWRRFRGRIITLLALNLLGTAMGAAAILG